MRKQRKLAHSLNSGELKRAYGRAFLFNEIITPTPYPQVR